MTLSSSLSILFLVITSLQPQAKLTPEFGWLYRGGQPRLVRFVTVSDAPDAPDLFFPAPQTSGFIFMKDNTFSISVAEPWGGGQLVYKQGVLTITGIGDFASRKGERLTFEEALSISLGEIGCASLRRFSADLLENRTGSTANQNEIRRGSQQEGFDAVLGKARGSLSEFTEFLPVFSRPGISKRTICTFKVLSGGHR